jgi:phosphoglycolate phosphatase-like HAD superfamily hydrolase
MLPLRIAFDMDGTLADLASAYGDMEERLFGAAEAGHERPAPESREIEQHADDTESPAPTEALAPRPERRAPSRHGTRHRDQVWKAIESTPNFWTLLKPIEPGIVDRLYQ